MKDIKKFLIETNNKQLILNNDMPWSNKAEFILINNLGDYGFATEKDITNLEQSFDPKWFEPIYKLKPGESFYFKFLNCTYIRIK